MIKVDFHVHSTYSDGNLSCADILHSAFINGLDEISITDHDTIINIKKMIYSQTNNCLKVIPGIEISTDYKGMHILGYNIKDFETIEKKLYNLKKSNEEKNIETIEILKKHGINISVQEVKEIAMMDVITYRDIVKYLIKTQYVNNATDAYKKYIGRNAFAYVPSKSFGMDEVIELIEETGGFAVLAHPYTLNGNYELVEILEVLIKSGLLGIESISPQYSRIQKDIYKELAKKYNLIETAGTDFHDYRVDELGTEIDKRSLEKFHEKVYSKM